MQFYFVFASACMVTNTLTQILEFNFGLYVTQNIFPFVKFIYAVIV